MCIDQIKTEMTGCCIIIDKIKWGTIDMIEPLLEVFSLSKHFDSLSALDNVSFTLNPGEIIGLVGRRGAGKTSLLHAIGGVSLPSGGEIILNGKQVFTSTPAQAHTEGIELIHQSPHLVKHMDIVENIFLGREICWPAKIGFQNKKRMYERAKELLADFDLSPSFLKEHTGSLNNEDRQVVAIARSLCIPPKLLLIDEALSSLSFRRQEIFLNQIHALAEKGSGIIISSDNFKHLFSLTNRILVLYEGHLLADRKTDNCTPREIVELIVGKSSRDQITPIVWALESFHSAQRQTEELYRAQAALHQSLEASDSLNRKLIKQLGNQVKALDTLNMALQETQRRLLTEREEERKAMSRELHDQVIQDLLSFNYRLEEVEGNEIAGEQRGELKTIQNGIRRVVDELRELCRDLRPPTIDNHGLPSAIRSLAQEWSERNNIMLHLTIDSELDRLPESIELSVFRIVQEGLSNIRKHAAANKVELTLQLTPMDNVLVRLADNGQGAKAPPDLGDLSASKHFGLLGISERAALLGGSMKIKLPPEGGLVLEVEIPSPYPSG
jgi:signal transduction histidine kinase